MLSSVMLLLQLLSSVEAGSKLQLSTAYLNLARRFEQELGNLSDVRAAPMHLRSAFISAINCSSGHHGRCCLVHPAVWCSRVHRGTSCVCLRSYKLCQSAACQHTAGFAVLWLPCLRFTGTTAGIELFPMVWRAAAGGHRHADSLTRGEWVLWQQRCALCGTRAPVLTPNSC